MKLLKRMWSIHKYEYRKILRVYCFVKQVKYKILYMVKANLVKKKKKP